MNISSQNINLDINLNRVSTNSRTFSKNNQSSSVQSNESTPLRESPLAVINGDNFVIVDGQKLSLSARRGTYLDIFV